MKNKTTLTRLLFDITVGQLLGDAYADKSSPTSNTRLTWSFGSEFLEYAEYINTCFRDYCKKGVYAAKVVAKKGGNSHTNYRLKTATMPVFNTFYDMFYITDPVTNKRIKVVPLMINELMNSIVLAHLIMGDGNYHSGDKIVRIYTNSFTLSDCQRLADSISNLGVKTVVKVDRVSKTGKKQYILKIRHDQLRKLHTLVTPHMHKSMMYRIGL